MLFFLNISFMDNLTALSVIFLCIFCLYLYSKNKKLNSIIEELMNREKDKYLKNDYNEEIVKMEDISNNIKEEKIVDVCQNKKEIMTEEKSSDLQKDIVIEKTISTDNVDNKKVKFDVEDFIRRDKVINRKLDSGMNSDYLAEVSRELANNVVPQTIKLTDYEQEQEDNAIISYKELLNVNKNNNVVDDGTVEFIEELKKFRNNLRR